MGEEEFNLGVGSISVRFPGKNYIDEIANFYFVPKNMANNLSPVYMKLFSGFKRNLIKPIEYCGFIDH